MKIENIKKAKTLIEIREAWKNILEKEQIWGDDVHFEFVENFAKNADRIRFPYNPQMEKKIMELIAEEVAHIEEQLKEL
jgi:hypothetical protein